MHDQNQNLPDEEDAPAPDPFENLQEKTNEALPENFDQKDS
jgi:hypothetical protein